MADKFLGTLRVDLVAFSTGFEQGLDRSSRKLAKFGRDTERQYRAIGRSLTQNITLPVIAAGTAALFASDKIAQAQRNISVATGATGEDLGELNDILDNIATDMPDSLEDISSVMGILNTQTGDLGESLEDLTKIVLAGSRVMGEDATQNAGQLGRVLRQFNRDADEGADIYARLFENSQKYDVTIAKQLENIRTFGPVLTNANVSLEQQADLFARLESVGIDVSRVMPGINQATRRFAEAGLEVYDSLVISVNAIRDAKDETEALTIATELFGSEGAARLTRAIRDGVVAFEELGGEISATGEGILEFEELNRTFGERMSRIGNRLLVELAPVGDHLMNILEDAEPMLHTMIDIAGDFMQAFSDLPPATRNTIVAVAGLLAVAGPTATVMGIMVGAVSKLGVLSLAAVKPVASMVRHLADTDKNAKGATRSLSGLLAVGTKIVAVAAAGFGIGTFLGTEVRAVEEFAAKVIASVQVTWVELRRLWNWGTGELQLLTLEFVNWALDLIDVNVSGFMNGLASGINAIAPGAAVALRATAPALQASVDAFWATSGLTEDAIRDRMKATSEALDDELLNIGDILDTTLEALEDKYSDPDRVPGAAFAEQIRGYVEPVRDMLGELLGGTLSVPDLLGDLEQIQDQVSAIMDAVPESRLKDIPKDVAEITGSIDDLIKALEKSKKKGKETGDEFSEQFKGRMLDAVEGWSRGVSTELTNFLFDAEATFDDVLDSFVRMLTQMVIQELIFAPLLGALRGAFGLGGGSGTTQAHGGAWSGGSQITRYAQGGVVNSPTFFGMSRPGSYGLMGEAGPEAIMPLTRIGGDLGVRAVGAGGAPVVVNVIDQRSSGEQVGVSESRGPNGERQIEILVRDTMANLIGAGKLDRVMNDTYGVRRRSPSR